MAVDGFAALCILMMLFAGLGFGVAVVWVIERIEEEREVKR